MKMISIDDLIEYCDNERTAYKANNCGNACTAIRRVTEFAKEYAVEAEPDKGWISVKDRLPDDGVEVLVHDTFCGVLIGWYDKEDNTFESEFINQLDDVTHWMPLPSTEGLNEA